LNNRQDDFIEIDEFYSWIRDYWADLSSSPEGDRTNVLNFGYWPPGCESLFDAQQAFFDTVVSLLGQIPADAQGVEVGCGIGGFAARLLERYSCRLICFDLLELHLELTRRHAERKGVADRLQTVQGNSMDMAQFSEDKLDFVYCIESSFHYDEKQKFFDAVHRAMKPDAGFVFADISREDHARISFRSGNHFSSRQELDDYVTNAGFRIVAHQDIGNAVYGPLHEYIRVYNRSRFSPSEPGRKKSKVARYWELVLNNYAQLNSQDLMGYQIYKLQK